MKLIKVSILSFISTVVKLLSGLAINKMVSVYIGPSGIAMIGQLQSFTQMITTLGTAGIGSGVVSLTSENRAQEDKLKRLWQTAIIIVVFLSSIISLFIYVYSEWLSVLIFKSKDFYFVLNWSSITLIFINLNVIFLAIINGLKEIKLYISLLIKQSIYSLIATCLLIHFFAIDGVLIAFVTNQVFIFILSFFNVIKCYNERDGGLFYKFSVDLNQLKKLLSFSLMALTSAIIGPVTLFLIRNYISDNYGINYSGYWQAMWYISTMYLMVITTALSTYYLPKLSELKKRTEIKSEIKKVLFFVLPVVLVSSFSIYLTKDYIVRILFSSDFNPMLSLFKWQLIGDIFKLMAWVFSYVLIAKAKVKIFIISEVLYFSLFFVFTVILSHVYGWMSVTYAYAIINVMYLVSMFFIVSFLFKREDI